MTLDDWSELLVKDLIEAGHAETKTGPFGTQLKASSYVETGTPVINVRNIGFGSIRPEKLEFIGPDTVKRLSTHLLREKDIVFGRKGAVERHAFIRPEQNNWFQGSDCLRLRFNDNGVVLPRFVSYFLLTEEHKSWMMNQCSHGATMASLNQDIISRIPLRLPPLPTQHKIASILSAYDDLIENNTRRIAILEEMAQAIYREWFVNFRFPGHENVKLVDSPLGQIPEGWEVLKLADCCKLVMGQSPKSEFYNETGEGLPFHQGVTNFGPRYPTHKTFCTVKNRLADQGDILFSVRAPVGRINIANTEIIVGRGVSAIRRNDDAQVFLFHQLKDEFKEEDIMGGGTIFKSVTKNDLATLPLVNPPADVLAAFESAVGASFTLYDTLTRKNAILRNTRDLLLPKLISGKLDVENLDIDVGMTATQEALA